ncbi:hypothetical protein NE237_033247 [Protea cynaroides]|uniref:Uncharacterized protein n=1 Tax=Protea cynaroides TaxID=273540 RepID=A0A9Q0R4M2_9MAGN|nr:hypothetical protein NE237_033247 [Protea cynaroides]
MWIRVSAGNPNAVAEGESGQPTGEVPPAMVLMAGPLFASGRLPMDQAIDKGGSMSVGFNMSSDIRTVILLVESSGSVAVLQMGVVGPTTRNPTDLCCEGASRVENELSGDTNCGKGRESMSDDKVQRERFPVEDKSTEMVFMAGGLSPTGDTPEVMLLHVEPLGGVTDEFQPVLKLSIIPTVSHRMAAACESDSIDLRYRGVRLLEDQSVFFGSGEGKGLLQVTAAPPKQQGRRTLGSLRY